MRWKSTFAFAFLAQVLGILGFSFCTPFLPFFVGDLGVKDAGAQAFWAGIALASAGFTFAVFAPIWGVMADRYGRKLMVCRAMFGGALSLLLMSFANTVPQLVVCRVFQGVFSGTLAASIALVASVVPQHRTGVTLGMMQAAVFIGNAIGPFFGGLAADAFGYRVSFRIGALLTLLGGVLVYLGTRESFTPHTAEDAAESQGFRSILLLPGFLVSAAILFGVRLSNSLANPSFPLIVKDILTVRRNLNSITGSVMAASAVAAAVSAAVLGHFGDKLGHRRILVGCCLGAGVASAGHFFAGSLPPLFAVRILFGLTVAGMLPAANATIHAVVDERSIGRAYGLATSLSMLGSAIGPAMGGYLAMQAGLRVPFLVTAAAQVALALLVLAFFREHRPGRQENTP
ncbi:MAG: MFS transporter [Rhodospirillaceae bacterium]|jgi:MFS transporter, DHA1 family, multidrug resistance protein|nr:MFS transporter [Rhodospirillaceae bacterium]